ncbi:MAG: acetyltransferase [Acidobacteriia bacterium]|nr:acetyltransferase [Terriglobia bacterium]
MGTLLGLTLLAVTGLRAQSVMQGSGPNSLVRIFNTDSAVLESQEVRKDLPCTVTPVKPTLGFDLRFHAGYEVSIPLKDLAGSEDLLTMIFRVTPDEHKDDPVYFSQRLSVPAIEESAKGSAYLEGAFDLGEGTYHVDFLMRDRSERVCSFFWDAEAELPPKDKQLVLMAAPGTIQAADSEPFKDEPPVEREAESGPLNVKVIINFAPQNSRSATLQPLDTNALASILKSIAREPRIRKFSIVAFNVQEQRVVYRQENTDQINFPALGEALSSLNLGTVDLKRLSQKHGQTEFLAGLLTDEVNNGKDHPDAVIFAGPKVMLEESVPQESLNQLADVDYPVFYMNFNTNPQANPWRDAIGNAVKRLKGYEYTISRPRDLWYAWTEIMSRIVKLRVGKSNPAPSQ